MGLKASVMIARRALVRRKIKNLSSILAITLGVTLLVGIQITTDTLENTFLTTLLQTEGEVDIRISNATVGGYLSATDEAHIEALLPNAVGLMAELSTQLPVMMGSQFDPSAAVAGIPVDYPNVFGRFYEWGFEKELQIGSILTDNTSVLLSSRLAEDLAIDQDISLPVPLNTEFLNISVSITIDPVTGQPVVNSTYTLERVQLSIVGIFDSNRPGIGSQYRGVVFALEHLQEWKSLEDPVHSKDRVSAYLVALKTDHFLREIEEEFLQEEVDELKQNVPKRVDPITGVSSRVYRVDSPRLTFFSIAELFINLLSTMLTALGLLIMITGILLISNVQLMSVEDREFHIGILRAVGENKRGVFQSMLLENLFQGVLGGIIGLFGGLAFGQAVAFYLVGLFGTGELSVRPVVSQQVVVLSVIVGIVLGIITGLLPALRASRVNIVEALRGIKVSFREKSSRNLVFIGILIILLGCFFLSINGVLDDSSQVLWISEGWDSLGEWRNILMGVGLLTTGLGFVASRFVSRLKAIAFIAMALWILPSLFFGLVLGEWVTDFVGLAPDILIVGIAEIMIGAILFVAINLTPIMNALRRSLVKIGGMKGVAQVAPALISSHRTRSTLTFAIFAVVLTLNVTVATLVTSSFEGTIAQAEEDSRGVDLYLSLSKPEILLNGSSFTEELYRLDPEILDIIGFKTFSSVTDFSKFAALKDPYSLEFDPQADLLPFGYGELRSHQIRGNASDSSDPTWRYDFHLSSFPDGVREQYTLDKTDEELLDMSKDAWDSYFDSAYRMPAYNVSMISFLAEDIDLSDFRSLGTLTGNELKDASPLQDNTGALIENPIVFTDSLFIPVGLQVWIPMNTSAFGVPVYQAFTVGGRLDSERAGGFPLSTFALGGGEGNFAQVLGKLYLSDNWSNQTNFLGEADGPTPTSRAPNQFDFYLIKTSYNFDDERVGSLAAMIETFTNTNDEGYRLLAGDNFIVASTRVLYLRIKSSLEMVERMISFLQIYVTFGLVIGAVGLAVISIRNVAERKREIGMMRAIGFPRTQVMLSVLLELVVLGLIGL
ncbi:MAG: FtsX-like permease family protein, partial [Candidatus Bathyarchaeota archaeon]